MKRRIKAPNYFFCFLIKHSWGEAGGNSSAVASNEDYLVVSLLPEERPAVVEQLFGG